MPQHWECSEARVKEVVLGIGNTLRGDDGIGVHVVESVNKRLEGSGTRAEQNKSGRSDRRIVAIDCGTTPENYTSIIREHGPDRLVLVDAAEMGLPPGSYRIIPPERTGIMSVSTHSLPLSLFLSYVGEFCREVVLVAVQPGRMNLGGKLSRAVRMGGEQVASLIIEGRLDEIGLLETQAFETGSTARGS
ncbi:MAG: hydrogenase 3 maturation endopeptidase HyCI [Chloroflexi bacterium]|nr:hydrogenase 3 maturation endopeptidase HyCI [Chloroflexota bacterium]